MAKQSIKSGVANLSPSGAGVIAAVNALGAAIGEQTRRIGGIGDEVESMAPGPIPRSASNSSTSRKDRVNLA